MNKYAFSFIFMCVFLFMGCVQNDGNNDALPNEPTNNKFLQVENSSPSPNKQERISNETIATHLANVAGDIPNVNDAAAIVAGPYAVVGIDVDADLDKSRVGTIKYSVSEALQHDRYGKTAVVIADIDIMERIRSMSEKVQEGHPIQGIIDELSAIIGRTMPDFPVDDDQPADPDQNKQIIDEQEEEHLDEIERKQSTDK